MSDEDCSIRDSIDALTAQVVELRKAMLGTPEAPGGFLQKLHDLEGRVSSIEGSRRRWIGVQWAVITALALAGVDWIRTKIGVLKP